MSAKEDAFEVITDGRFYTNRSLHQHVESWVDDDDRFHIDTEDARLIIDPRMTFARAWGRSMRSILHQHILGRLR